MFSRSAWINIWTHWTERIWAIKAELLASAHYDDDDDDDDDDVDDIDDWSQIKVHTDERTQVHSARSSLTVTHPSIHPGRQIINDTPTGV